MRKLANGTIHSFGIRILQRFLIIHRFFRNLMLTWYLWYRIPLLPIDEASKN